MLHATEIGVSYSLISHLAHMQMLCYVCLRFSGSKLKVKQYKQKTSLKSYKPEIKIFSNPGLVYLKTREKKVNLEKYLSIFTYV